MTDAVVLVDPKTLEVVARYKNKKETRSKTGIGWEPLSRRLNVSFKSQTPFKFSKGQIRGEYLICFEDLYEKYSEGLKLMDPNAAYVVTDGTLVYHGPALLEECLQLKRQIGFSTLKVQPWKEK